MQRVVLIENPVSGPYVRGRMQAMEEALGVLRDAGVTVESWQADGPGSATELARKAVSEGFDTVIACGGDGTVHEVLQCMVGTKVALGVIPFGTANALAADLGLIAPPVEVARRLLKARAVRIPVGRIDYQDDGGKQASRYFVVAAGIGADALLMSRMDSRLKRKLGYLLYLIEALKVWLTHSFPYFEATFTRIGDDEARVVEVSQLLAVRVRSFGGALQELVPGATLNGGKLSLLAFRTRSRFRMLKFLLAVIFRRHTFNGMIEKLDAQVVNCKRQDGAKMVIYVEADGEVLGELPARIEVVPKALTLLIPVNARP